MFKFTAKTTGPRTLGLANILPVLALLSALDLAGCSSEAKLSRLNPQSILGMKKSSASPSQSSNDAVANKNAGAINIALTDSGLASTVSTVTLTVTATDSGTPLSRSLTQLFASGQVISMDDLPAGTYKITLTLIDSIGTAIARGEQDQIKIVSGAVAMCSPFSLFAERSVPRR